MNRRSQLCATRSDIPQQEARRRGIEPGSSTWQLSLWHSSELWPAERRKLLSRSPHCFVSTLLARREREVDRLASALVLRGRERRGSGAEKHGGRGGHQG